MTDWRLAFQEAFPNLDCKLDWPLKQQTYFKLGGSAELFIQVSDLDLIQQIRRYVVAQDLKLTILGGASNVIVADEGVTGLVLQLINQDISISAGVVKAGAGFKTALLVRETLNAGLTGLEYFLGVPGNLGGAVFNNAHYLNQLISQYILRVQVITPTGAAIWLTKTECDFGYDKSRFQNSREIIWQVEFDLPTGTKEESLALIKQATEHRVATQPLGLPSSGCIFQNVPNTAELKTYFPQFSGHEFVPGGFLIDQASLKGLRIGDLEVSQKHAAFIINHGNGTSADLIKLIAQVKAAVKLKFGVELHEEVFYIH